MAFVNVRRDVDDKFYRYRMPVMLTKVEGRGNGIKTVIPNMSDVAKALSRPPQYPTKFFGCELGAQTILDEKTDRWIVNGEHNAERLRELLDAFIEKFVLCAACKNPETELVITKNETIIRDCKACGQQSNVDMRHRLTTFIIKNPPKKSKKARKTTKDSESKAEGGSGDDISPTAENDDDDELARRLAAEAAELPTPEQAAIAGEDWSEDVSPEAVAKRVAELALNDDGDDERSDDHFGTLVVWLEINREQATPASVMAKLEELGIKERHKTAQILAESLFTSNIMANQEIKKFLPVFREIVMPKNASEVEKKEKHQKALLGGLERLVGIHYPDLIALIPRILMEWYQADILTEDTVKQWGTHVSKKYVDRDTSKRVRKASEPFLKWLDEAEDDDEEDE